MGAGASTGSSTKVACTIEHYTCSEDGDIIEELANIANSQSNAFNIRVHPWKVECKFHDVQHYVARAPDNTICGWMRVTYDKGEGEPNVYINEISTRRIRDQYYGGIGNALHNALIEDAKKQNMCFIYLVPIDVTARSVYLRWGYTAVEGVDEMFYVLKSGYPSEEFLEVLEKVDSIIRKVESLASFRPRDNYLKDISKIAEPLIDADKTTNEQIKSIIDNQSYSLEETRQKLRDFFEKLLTENGISLPPGLHQTGGRKRTMRRRHKVRNSRKLHRRSINTQRS